MTTDADGWIEHDGKGMPVDKGTSDEATPETGYVLVKRGLYYRPDAQGYTGILAQAGIYSAKESERRVDERDGVTRIKFSDAEEVTSATWMDIQRDYWREEALRLRAMMAERSKK